MVSYIDLEYYQNFFSDISVPYDSFERIAREASLFVREITFNRIDEENIIEEVKDAVCAVCEVIYKEEKELENTNGREIKSENTDGYSVTYVTEQQDGVSRQDILWNKKYQAARPYLLHTGLLNRGCY